MSSGKNSKSNEGEEGSLDSLGNKASYIRCVDIIGNVNKGRSLSIESKNEGGWN